MEKPKQTNQNNSSMFPIIERNEVRLVRDFGSSLASELLGAPTCASEVAKPMVVNKYKRSEDDTSSAPSRMAQIEERYKPSRGIAYDNIENSRKAAVESARLKAEAHSTPINASHESDAVDSKFVRPGFYEFALRVMRQDNDMKKHNRTKH